MSESADDYSLHVPFHALSPAIYHELKYQFKNVVPSNNRHFYNISLQFTKNDQRKSCVIEIIQINVFNETNDRRHYHDS